VVIEVRRLFPALVDNDQARDRARIIAGWQPVAMPPAGIRPCRGGHDPNAPARGLGGHAGRGCPIQASSRRAWSPIAATAYVLVADTLAGLEAQMPIGLIQMEPADPPEIVGGWFPTVAS
jgi:hypothetical protein